MKIKEQKKKMEPPPQKNTKMVDLNPTMSILALNENGLQSPSKNHILSNE